MTIQIKDLTVVHEIDMSAVRGGISSVSPIALRAGLDAEASEVTHQDFSIPKYIDKSSTKLFF